MHVCGEEASTSGQRIGDAAPALVLFGEFLSFDRRVGEYGSFAAMILGVMVLERLPVLKSPGEEPPSCFTNMEVNPAALLVTLSNLVLFFRCC